METEPAALAASLATTVVGLMATDEWAAVRTRVAGLLSGEPDPDRETGHARAAAGLERERHEVIEAIGRGDLETLTDLEAVWRARLRRLVAGDPAAAAALRSLVTGETSGGGDQRRTARAGGTPGG